MYRFKVGDRVVVTGNHNDGFGIDYIGKIGTITELGGNNGESGAADYRVLFPDGSNWMVWEYNIQYELDLPEFDSNPVSLLGLFGGDADDVQI